MEKVILERVGRLIGPAISIALQCVGVIGFSIDYDGTRLTQRFYGG